MSISCTVSGKPETNILVCAADPQQGTVQVKCSVEPVATEQLL